MQSARRSLPFMDSEAPATTRQLPSWIVPTSGVNEIAGRALRSSPTATTEATTTKVDDDGEQVMQARILAIQELASREVAVLRAKLEAAQAEAQMLARQLQDSRDANVVLTQAIGRAREDLFADSEGELLRLAIAVATRVVGREIETPGPVVTGWVREAIAMYGGGAGLTLHVSQDLAATLTGEQWDAATVGLKVVVDQDLQGIVCVLEGKDTRAVLSAGARIDAVAEALGIEPATGAA